MRRPPRGSDPTRRQYLRRTAAGLGVGGLAATAGCLGGVRDDISSPATAIGGTSATTETSLSSDEFTAYAESQRERYGDHGVWGAGGTEPDHGLKFAGAWTRRVGVTTDGSPDPQPDSTDGLRAVADAAVAAYEIPRNDDEADHYQLWLWAAGNLLADTDGGLLAASPELRRVEIGVGLTGDGAAMGPYAPGSDRSTGPVTVGSDSPNVGGPAASVPLESGEIRVVPDRTGFDENAYAVEWRGHHDGRQSVNATCEAAWEPGAAPAFDLSARLAADRRRL